MATITCPKCKNPLPEEARGTTIACASCGTQVRVPAAPAPKKPEPAPVAPLIEPEDEPEDVAPAEDVEDAPREQTKVKSEKSEATGAAPPLWMTPLPWMIGRAVVWFLCGAAVLLVAFIFTIKYFGEDSPVVRTSTGTATCAYLITFVALAQAATILLEETRRILENWKGRK